MDTYDDEAVDGEAFSDYDDVDSEDDDKTSDVTENNETDVFTEMSPRPYQSELEKKALSRNTIIHLPTGSGKTFIAILLIKRAKKDLKLPYSKGGKRTFFLVNTVPLVEQQVKVIGSLLPLKAAGYSSEDNVDFWDYEKWLQELDANQVLVMTSQILLDMLIHKYVELSKINLLIFDECHQAVDEHPMRQIMREFEFCPVNERPRVLGLTAILLNSTVSIPNLTEKIKMLETTFHATIATVDDLGEVLSYSTDPLEMIVEYDLPSPCPASKRVVEKLQNLQLTVKGFPGCSNVPNIQLKPGEKLLNNTTKKVFSYKMNNQEREDERIRLILMQSDSEDDLLSDGSENEDHLSTRSQDSDTEQNASSEFEGEESNDQVTNSFYIGKDGTRWSKNPPRQQVRTRSENIIRQTPGVSPTARSAQSERECWS